MDNTCRICDIKLEKYHYNHHCFSCWWDQLDEESRSTITKQITAALIEMVRPIVKENNGTTR